MPSLAVITGASSGIGEVFARKLAPRYDLLLVARNKGRLETLAGELAAQHGSVIKVLGGRSGCAREMHRVHVMALVRLSHAALRVLVPKNRGAAINLGSGSSFVQRPGNASYGATKSWVTAFSEGLYVDLKQANSAVRVQALCPGFTYSSLAALRTGTLIVVPGWRYKWLVAIARRLPFWLKLRMESPRR